MRAQRFEDAMAAVLVGAMLIVALTGCATVPPQPTPVGASSCETACARLAQLGCNAAKPTSMGTPCATVCANVETSGVVSYSVECVTTAESCAAADRCGGPAR